MTRYSDNEMGRKEMVERTILSRGIEDKRVIEAMLNVERRLFVPEEYRIEAYEDTPLPIGYSQTISQPYIVALMTELAEIDSTSIVLEVGTGSGYQTAILAEIADFVFTVEIISPLAKRAKKLFDSLGYDNIEARCGDGFHGWPEHAPFDAIVVTAAPARIPEPLLSQLADNGKLVIPLGENRQELEVVTSSGGRVSEKSILSVRFVPMTGEIEVE